MVGVVVEGSRAFDGPGASLPALCAQPFMFEPNPECLHRLHNDVTKGYRQGCKAKDDSFLAASASWPGLMLTKMEEIHQEPV